MMKFFTIGYNGRNVAEIVEFLDKHSAVLADIRSVKTTGDLEWSRDYLSLMLKKRYRHVGALGDRNFGKPGAEIQIQNLSAGIRFIELWETNVIFLCACEDYQTCHRRIIAEELAKRGHSVEELTSSKEKSDAPPAAL